MIKFYIYLQSR